MTIESDVYLFNRCLAKMVELTAELKKHREKCDRCAVGVRPPVECEEGTRLFFTLTGTGMGFMELMHLNVVGKKTRVEGDRKTKVDGEEKKEGEE
jgi:hypothetical protein